MVQRSLYEMIGVSEDADPDDVRYAYEQAMRMATRGGDHRRAVDLSAAFDGLDPRTRRQIFPAARSGVGSARGEHSASLRAGDYDLGPSYRSGAPRMPRTSRQWVRTVAATVVGVSLASLIGLYVWRTEIPHSPTYPSPLPRQAPVAGPQLVVPSTAAVDQNGTVTIACDTASNSYETTAFPGDTVSCTNGATPELIQSG